MTQVDFAQTLLIVRDDTGPFAYLGGKFYCNSVLWIGDVIVTPLALYLLKCEKNMRLVQGHSAGALITQALFRDDEFRTCIACELPHAIQEHLDPKNKYGDCAVVIIPRDAVTLVKTYGPNNLIRIEVGSDVFKVVTNLLLPFITARAMKRLGWTLNTRLSPSLLPIHDTRNPEQRATYDVPLTKRIAMLIFAIILLIVFVAVRAAMPDIEKLFK